MLAILARTMAKKRKSNSKEYFAVTAVSFFFVGGFLSFGRFVLYVFALYLFSCSPFLLLLAACCLVVMLLFLCLGYSKTPGNITPPSKPQAPVDLFFL